MGILDGQSVNAAVTNPAFINKNQDDSTPSKLEFANADTVSGSTVTNAQREHNSIASFVGKALNAVKNALPTWLNNDVGLSTDNLQERSDKLTERFNETTGHTHDGNPGEGGLIAASSIDSVPLQGTFLQATDLTGVTGSSLVVTTEMSGKVPSSSSTDLGVVVSAPYNKVFLRTSSGVTDDDHLVDTNGNIVYGRLTYSATVWTLSFYVNLSGTETAYSFGSSTDISWYYQELFNPLSGSYPVYSVLSSIPSENVTPDVVAPYLRAGEYSLSASDASKAVVFSSAMPSTSYTPHAYFVNTVDSSPMFQPITITALSTTGFTASWNVGVDSANYVLKYSAIRHY